VKKSRKPWRELDSSRKKFSGRGKRGKPNQPPKLIRGAEINAVRPPEKKVREKEVGKKATSEGGLRRKEKERKPIGTLEKRSTAESGSLRGGGKTLKKGGVYVF